MQRNFETIKNDMHYDNLQGRLLYIDYFGSLIIFFYFFFFFFFQKIGFDISCDVSPLEAVSMKHQDLLSGKKYGKK